MRNPAITLPGFFNTESGIRDAGLQVWVRNLPLTGEAPVPQMITKTQSLDPLRSSALSAVKI